MAGFVYALLDPRTSEVRYIGQTYRSLDVRFKEHIKEAGYGPKTRKNRWVNSLLKRGMEPQISLVEVVPTEASLNQRERYWIAFYRRSGARLTNSTNGGDGVYDPPSPETVAKIVEMYTGGASFPTVCKALRVSTATVGEILRSHDVPIRPRGRQRKKEPAPPRPKRIVRKPTRSLTTDELTRMLSLYSSGVGIETLRDVFEMHYVSIRKILQANGVVIRKGGGEDGATGRKAKAEMSVD